MAHMLLTTHGTRGDVLPFIVLGQALRDSGHDVTLFTHCLNEAEALEAGLNFVAWDTKEEWDEYIRFSQLIKGPMREIEQYTQFFVENFNMEKCKRELAKLKPYCELDDTVLVARFSSSISALLAAEIYQKPIVSFFLTPSYITQIRIDHDLCGESNTRLLNMVRDSLGLPPVKSYTEWTCIMKYKVGLWSRWFYPPGLTEMKNFITVGFPDYSIYKTAARGLTKDVEEFLAQGEAPIIISGSSGKDFTLNYFDTAIEACIQLGLRVLVVTPFYELVANHLNGNKNNALKWVDFIDFEALLPHAKAIIHHGGIGTIIYALRFKVPQLILAGNIDRPFNASLIKKLNLGQFLPMACWSVNNIQAAVKEVLNDTIRANCNYYAELMQKEKAMAKAAKIIVNAAGNPKFLIDIDKILATGAAQECTACDSETQANGPKVETPSHEKLPHITDQKKEILARLLHEKLKGGLTPHY